MKLKPTVALLSAIFATGSVTTAAMTLTSDDIQEGSRMSHTFSFNGFGCDGANTSPQLSWKDAPKGTKSFAITAYDPDAPTESGFWHWQVINIPANVTDIPKGHSGKFKKAKELTNDYGATGFGGACPPKGHGMHRYQFTVWALPSETLGVPDNASKAVVGFMLNANALDKARLTSTYVNE
ncbi:MAG: YbhB/YbcL family Raf kinase inhibitor-like protein [Bermanella sp.]|nr:YbhB/YbcL family Raf kinase inhibitor-like protein [Bermanella sp.]